MWIRNFTYYFDCCCCCFFTGDDLNVGNPMFWQSRKCDTCSNVNNCPPNKLLYVFFFHFSSHFFSSTLIFFPQRRFHIPSDKHIIYKLMFVCLCVCALIHWYWVVYILNVMLNLDTVFFFFFGWRIRCLCVFALSMESACVRACCSTQCVCLFVMQKAKWFGQFIYLAVSHFFHK